MKGTYNKLIPDRFCSQKVLSGQRLNIAYLSLIIAIRRAYPRGRNEANKLKSKPLVDGLISAHREQTTPLEEILRYFGKIP
jgi:hypothetical protein